MSTSEEAIQEKQTILEKLKSFPWNKLGLPIAIILLAAFFSWRNPNFLTYQNLSTLSRQLSVLAIVCAGQTLIMISGGIDLSNEAVMSLVSVYGASMILLFGLPMGILIALLIGIAATGAQGVLFAKLGIPAFIVTLGGQTFFRGWTFVYSKGQPIVLAHVTEFGVLGQGNFWGIPIPFFIALFIYIIFHFILTNTRMGRYLYAIGGNTEAAMLSGVNTSKYRIYAFLIAGLCVAIASLILTSRVISGQPTLATGFALETIAAVVIGGTSLRGGEGSIVQTAFGVCLVAIIGNGLNLIRVSSFVQMMVLGAIIVLAVLLDVYQKRNRA